MKRIFILLLVGQNEDALIAAWGVPDKEYRLSDGKKAIAYVHKDTVKSGGYTYTYPQTVYQSGTIGDKVYRGTSTSYVTETTPIQKSGKINRQMQGYC